ncbi:MAG: SpoIIE family protein phosphatase [Leptolyngbyaceae cyanobacterium SL_7_1]|nr:SpoIIE family protein phosphatase [Leptolyngbyaceae cyanobacterium SL_7_1]
MAKILVIDDDPAIRLVLKKALQAQGYEVALAVNGKDGITQTQEIRPNLIICDWIMPLVDGLEVCRHIKENPELATIFFILLTSRDALEDRIRGLDTGADDFLGKPVEIGELQARVRAGLRLHQLSRDLQMQKQLLEAELAEAATYVRSLLPAPLTGQLRANSCFIPSRQLGGDCFDYYWLDPDYLVIYLLDVSGHGLGAALPSISILNLLRSQSLPDVNFYQPHDVLRALNETFQMNNQNEKYFTIWYGIYNHSRRQLTYGSAGHPPAILVTPTNNGTAVSRLRTPGVPIGMLTDVTFVSHRQDIPPGSKLYIFSDGIYDFNQCNSAPWGLEPFIDLLASIHEPLSFDRILEAIHATCGVITFEDDVSLLQLEFE